MSTEKNILEGAKNLFMQFGLKTITMDDIAKKVGVSKKTIYQFFHDKSSIVMKSVIEHFSEHKSDINSALDNSANAIQSFYNISKCMKRHIESTNPTVLYDLQRYFPKAYKKFLEFRDSFMRTKLEKILHKGIEEGYFRPEMNVKVLVMMRIVQVESTFNAEIYPRDQFDFKMLHEQLLDHFVYGILTEKGKEKYNQYLKEEQNA